MSIIHLNECPVKKQHSLFLQNVYLRAARLELRLNKDITLSYSTGRYLIDEICGCGAVPLRFQ